MYEHPSHREERRRRAVPPLLDIAGWNVPPKETPSLEGQQALPGLEDVERERKYRKRRDQGRGQQHLF